MESIINSEPESNQPEQPIEFRQRSFYAGVLFFAGVLLPVISLMVELASGINAEAFFDPLPTWIHVLLVAFVPVTNFHLWFSLRRKSTARLAYLSFANALVVFIALFYTIIYAPLLPLAFVALIFFFLGLLPMTPLLSLVATLLLRRELKKISPENAKPFGLRWAGLGAAGGVFLLLLTCAELPFALTRYGMQKASSDNPQIQAEGLRFLRYFRSDDYLLRNCYWHSGRVTTDFLSAPSLFIFEDEQIARQVAPEKAREIFYRLHGKSYDSVLPPRGARGGWEERERGARISDETGAEASRVISGLSVSASNMDGSVDGNAALGYLEWTLVFKNETQRQQEAVSEIQLPPDSVVSRLTLWINNEEREAAFAGRGRVTEAYNAVTATRRDPVLVTTAGRDRIAVRAFPVPPNGEMKVRIGITAPLQLENETDGLLLLPFFNERNFTVPIEHSLWIESKKTLAAANPKFSVEQRENLSAVRGKIKNEDLARTGAPVRAAKSADIKTAWARVAPDAKEIVRQEIVEKTEAAPSRLIFVVDASLKMREFQKDIVAALRTLPAETNAALVLTNGNGLNLETAAPNNFTGTIEQIASRIEDARFDGGTDGSLALETAWELANAGDANAAIFWIHTPQTVKLGSAESLKQKFTRRPAMQPIYSLQTVNGANIVVKEIDGYGKIRSVPRFGAFRDDLTRFLSNINQSASGAAQTVRRFDVVRRLETAANLPQAAGAKETSAHLVRLWANEEATRLLEQNEDRAALDLSVKYQLVTPVSGAVVLETQAQYDQFGLRPVDKNTVPTIPEPEEYALFAVVLLILSFCGWRYRKNLFRRGTTEAQG